jgi:chromosome segregation ATPase
MSANKKRKSSPNQWSWTSKLYNATSLAEEATEQSNTIEQLELALKRSEKKSEELSKNIVQLKFTYQEWKASCIRYQKKDESNQVQIASLESDNAQKQFEIVQLRQEMAEKTAQTKNQCGTLKAGNDQKQVENQKLQHELEEMKGIISDFKTILHKTKRECTENRARKKMWKKKYEELANMGAIALAKVTKESYGVTPEQFEAYKHIADTQFEVDKAEKMRTDALKLLHANTKALEDQ